jgi:hypothetical protein
VDLPQGVRLQRLAPRSSRARNAHPEWEVWVGTERIGLIQQWRVASASSTFFRATAFHSDTGAPIPLESSTDLGERVEKVIAARHDPDRFIHKASWE